MNGIEELATRSDLLDRALLLSLPRIPAEQRRNEKELWAAFERAKPALLGGLLDGLVCALANLDSVKLETLPRMADFARWVTAAEPGLGWHSGSFIASYESNRGQAHELAVEASSAGQALIELAGRGFRGTAAELLQTLGEAVEEKATRQKEWPGSPRKMSGLVKRLAPNLRELGYTIEYSREPGSARRRIIEIRPDDHQTVPTVPTVPTCSPWSAPQDDQNDPRDETNPSGPATELPWQDGRDDRDDLPKQQPEDDGGGEPPTPLRPH